MPDQTYCSRLMQVPEAVLMSVYVPAWPSSQCYASQQGPMPLLSCSYDAAAAREQQQFWYVPISCAAGPCHFPTWLLLGMLFGACPEAHWLQPIRIQDSPTAPTGSMYQLPEDPAPAAPLPLPPLLLPPAGLLLSGFGSMRRISEGVDESSHLHRVPFLCSNQHCIPQP
jgi:hypothetical protein